MTTRIEFEALVADFQEAAASRETSWLGRQVLINVSSKGEPTSIQWARLLCIELEKGASRETDVLRVHIVNERGGRRDGIESCRGPLIDQCGSGNIRVIIGEFSFWILTFRRKFADPMIFE